MTSLPALRMEGNPGAQLLLGAVTGRNGSDRVESPQSYPNKDSHKEQAANSKPDPAGALLVSAFTRLSLRLTNP